MIGRTQSNVVWGVEFGGSAVRRVRVTRTGDGFRADAFDESPLDERWERAPDLAVTPIGPEAAGEPLMVCVDDEMVLYRALSLPAADDEALDKMVRGQLEVLVPTQTDRFATGWCSFDDPRKEGHRRVMVCAARREAVAGVADACRRMGHEADGIVPSMLALGALWRNLGDGGDAPVVLLDVGARCTALGIVQRGRVLHCGVIGVGGDHWTERIAERGGVECGEGERRKLAYSADPAGGDPDGVVADPLREAMTEWSRQVREVYEDCVRDIPRDGRPTRCVLFGRGSRTPGLGELVSRALGIEAAPAEITKGISLPKGVDLDCAGAAIGAAICAMDADASVANLMDEADKARAPSGYRRWRSAGVWAALVAWVLAGLVTLYVLDAREAERLGETIASVRAADKRKGGLARELAIGGYLESGAPTPLEVLDRLSQAVPKKTLLSTLTYTRSGDVTIGGTVPNEKEFLTMLNDLTEVGKLEWRSGRPGKDGFRFDVRLKLSGPLTEAASQPTTKPATQPTTTPTTKPATQPTTTPTTSPGASATQPTTGPSRTGPASGPKGGGA